MLGIPTELVEDKLENINLYTSSVFRAGLTSLIQEGYRAKKKDLEKDVKGKSVLWTGFRTKRDC